MKPAILHKAAPTVLLTNIVLSGRSGTEVVTEQLADGLRRRGHDVMVFTPHAGALAQQMRSRGHVVVTDPSAVPRRPSVIHAHHTGPAMAAVAAHPGVPAVFVSHDATAPFDAAPPHPAFRRLFAVDERCRMRLLAEGAGSVTLLPNAVDLSRIPPRRAPLPARPARAVALTKHDAHLPAIRAACSAAGIALEAYGSGPGRMTEAPEALFAEADLVFATARTALEAAAAGAGVVVCDARGCAGFLTRARAETWLPWNLGAAVLTAPAELGPISAAIADWSAAEAAAASTLIRADHDLERLLDRIEAIHAALLAEPVTVVPAEAAAATGAFIAGWVPTFDIDAPWHRLALAVGHQAAPVAALQQPLTAIEREVTALSQQVTALGGGVATIASTIASQKDGLRTELATQSATQTAALAGLQEALAALHEATTTQAARQEARLNALEALLRHGLRHRLWNGAAALWRAVVPHAVRAPLHRWRRGGRAM